MVPAAQERYYIRMLINIAAMPELTWHGKLTAARLAASKECNGASRYLNEAQRGFAEQTHFHSSFASHPTSDATLLQTIEFLEEQESSIMRRHYSMVGLVVRAGAGGRNTSHNCHYSSEPRLDDRFVTQLDIPTCHMATHTDFDAGKDNRLLCHTQATEMSLGELISDTDHVCIGSPRVRHANMASTQPAKEPFANTVGNWVIAVRTWKLNLVKVYFLTWLECVESLAVGRARNLYSVLF
jgi:hypothetical protein